MSGDFVKDPKLPSGHRGQEQEGEGGRCPFCEADIADLNSWMCGTCTMPEGYHRGMKCKDRQISQLQERLEAWREYYQDSDCIWEGDAVMKRLKDLGEI